MSDKVKVYIDKSDVRDNFKLLDLLEVYTDTEILNILDIDDIIDYLEDRGYEVDPDYCEDEFDEDEAREQIEQEYKNSCYLLSRDFDRNSLRDHLLNITQSGHHISDDHLLEKLRDLLDM